VTDAMVLEDLVLCYRHDLLFTPAEQLMYSAYQDNGIRHAHSR
jgi:hypothetical protein